MTPAIDFFDSPTIDFFDSPTIDFFQRDSKKTVPSKMFFSGEKFGKLEL